MDVERQMSGNDASTQAPIRVLVVDDSAFMRFTIGKFLNDAQGITVLGSARDGEEALDLIQKLNPDVITLDVEMPHMDGLTTLREIMARFPRPVVMLSSLTSEGAQETVQALTIGAVDFITKPETKANMASIMEDIVSKVKKAAQAHVSARPKTYGQRESSLFSGAKIPSDTPPKTKYSRPMNKNDKVLVIGASTGGPRALNVVVPDISATIPAAVLIIQHMPVGFTRSLAERLDTVSQLIVKEAAPGDTLEVGRALVAPGGFHMVLDSENKIALNQSPPVHGVRPSVDVTMTSVVQHFNDAVVGVVLTGMGSDGTNGSMLIHSSGGWVIAESESTSVVWGMPRSVYEAGAANEVVPLPNVVGAIHKAVPTAL
jgi:two-component system chemotaxis response regulator CheB